jgi:hypothetical protein
MLFDIAQYHVVLIAVLVNGMVNIKLLHQRSLWCLQISSGMWEYDMGLGTVGIVEHLVIVAQEVLYYKCS